MSSFSIDSESSSWLCDALNVSYHCWLITSSEWYIWLPLQMGKHPFVRIRISALVFKCNPPQQKQNEVAAPHHTTSLLLKYRHTRSVSVTNPNGALFVFITTVFNARMSSMRHLIVRRNDCCYDNGADLYYICICVSLLESKWVAFRFARN